MEEIPQTIRTHHTNNSNTLRTTRSKHTPTSNNRRTNLRTHLRNRVHALHQRTHAQTTSKKQTSLQETPRGLPTSKRIRPNTARKQHLHVQQPQQTTPRTRKSNHQTKTRHDQRTSARNQTRTKQQRTGQTPQKHLNTPKTHPIIGHGTS